MNIPDSDCNMRKIYATNRLRKIVFCVIVFLCPLQVFGQDVRDVVGEATYYDDGTLSKVECMRRALEQARIDALAKEFGTIISQDILQTDNFSNGRETNDFLSLSSTEVKGEWIADLGEPVYEFSRDKDENLIVTCRIRGKAKAISNNSVSFEAIALRNGEKASNADTRYRDGDEMKLLFNASSDGFLCVFLQDESGKTYGLLPYPRDSKSEVYVKKDRQYLFFTGKDNEFGPSDELLMTAADKREYNRLFVVFSPSRFSRPVMSTGAEGIPSLRSEDFSKWLIKARRNDNRMGVKAINLEINPKQN